MDVNQILKELNISVEVGDTVERTAPAGCCGSSISHHQHTIKSIGVYKDSFGRKILLFELSSGDFVTEGQFVVVDKSSE